MVSVILAFFVYFFVFVFLSASMTHGPQLYGNTTYVEAVERKYRMRAISKWQVNTYDYRHKINIGFSNKILVFKSLGEPF